MNWDPALIQEARAIDLSPMQRTVAALRWGMTDYRDAARWQTGRAAAVADGSAAEAVLLLQHLPIYTMGRRGGREHLLAAESALAAPIVDSDRGGDITFHGPGQLVAYPILNLRERGLSVARHIRLLEQTMIDAAAAFGIAAERRRGQPGCWVGERKLGCVGVRVSRGVATHGLALNISTEIAWFEAIVPCGIKDARMTSLSEQLGRVAPIDEADDILLAALADNFALRLASPAAAAR